MRLPIAAACAAILLAAGASGAADRVFKPIDTESLVVKPSEDAANLVSRTMKLVGTGVANVVEKDGFVKTFNNLFRSPTPQTHQPNGLPLPSMFPSTQFKSYNTPQMPIMGRTPGRY